MSTITDLIPTQIIARFLRQHMRGKLIVVALSGAHASGYPSRESPIELKGIHVEPTENLVGLVAPPKAYNWVGELQEHRIDYSSEELGEALKKLLKGDGSILERILAQRQLVKGEDLRRLQKVTRGVICRRYFNHYRAFSKGVMRDFEKTERRTVRHLLGAYRTALTGVHLLRTGKMLVDLTELARLYGFSQLHELVRMHQKSASAVVADDNHWINRLVKLTSLLEAAMEETALPIDPDNPGAVEDYLLDMRRRFFDAPTLQEAR